MYVCIYISHDTQSAQISRIMKYEIMKTIYIYIYIIYIYPRSVTNGTKTWQMLKIAVFLGKLRVFISYLGRMKTVSMFYDYSLF